MKLRSCEILTRSVSEEFGFAGPDRSTPSLRLRVGACRRGMTLAELLVAASIMLLIAGATGTLAMTAHSANGFCQGQTACAQHGRVIINRIERAVQAAVANESFPGVLIISEQSGGSTLPSTLVVWSPTSTAANPSSLPLISEIVVLSPDP